MLTFFKPTLAGKIDSRTLLRLVSQLPFHLPHCSCVGRGKQLLNTGEILRNSQTWALSQTHDTAKSSGRCSPTSKRNFAPRRPGWKLYMSHSSFPWISFLIECELKWMHETTLSGGGTIYLIPAPKISVYLFVKTRKRFEKYQAVYSFCHIISS